MLPKKMLVATDGSRHASAALETGLELASRFGSSLGLLHVVDVRQLEGPFISDLSGIVGVSPFLNFQKQVKDLLYRKGETVLAAAQALCASRGVPATSELAEGVVSREICRAGRSFDLICLGRRGEHAAWSGLMLGSTVEQVVRGSSRPVLVAQGELAAAGGLLCPYDGSQTSSAALALAVEMAMNLGDPLTVLTVTSEPAEGEGLLAEARSFIAPRGLEAGYLQRPGDPADAIAAVAGQGYRMVVMGAFGHSRIRELFLGSTTSGVLAKTEVPVLLYR